MLSYCEMVWALRRGLLLQFKPHEVVASSVTTEAAREVLQQVYTAIRADTDIVAATPPTSKGNNKRRSTGECSRDRADPEDAWSLGPSSDGDDCEAAAESEALTAEGMVVHRSTMPPVLFEPALTRADHYRTVRKSKLTSGGLPRGERKAGV
jgi:hypothetical protein